MSENSCTWDTQGGPDSTAVKHNLTYNQWEDLDDSPISFHITEVTTCAFVRARALVFALTLVSAKFGVPRTQQCLVKQQTDD